MSFIGECRVWSGTMGLRMVALCVFLGVARLRGLAQGGRLSTGDHGFGVTNHTLVSTREVATQVSHPLDISGAWQLRTLVTPSEDSDNWA